MFGLNGISEELLLKELIKQKGEHKVLTIVTVVDENNELEVKKYHDNILSHVQKLEARNIELFNLAKQREESEVFKQLEKKKEEIQKLKSEYLKEIQKMKAEIDSLKPKTKKKKC